MLYPAVNLKPALHPKLYLIKILFWLYTGYEALNISKETLVDTILENCKMVKIRTVYLTNSSLKKRCKKFFVTEENVSELKSDDDRNLIYFYSSHTPHSP